MQDKFNIKRMFSFLIVISFMFTLITSAEGNLSTIAIDFANGELNGFTARENASLSVEQTESLDGTLSNTLLVNGNGAEVSITDKYEPYYEHQVVVFIKTDSEKDLTCNLKVQLGEEIKNVATTVVNAGKGWVQVLGKCRFYNELPASFYIECGDADASFYIMSVEIKPVTSRKLSFDPTLPALKDVYKDYFMLGNIINSKEIDTVKYDLLKHHFNTLTYENAMKPDAMWGDSVYPREPTFSVDQNIKRLVEDGFTIIGHTLAWHGQSPNWLNVASGSRDKPGVVYKTYEQAKSNLELFINTVAGRYYNNADGIKIYSWDVLNEAIDHWGSDPVPFDVTWQEKATGATSWLSPLYGAYQNGHDEAPWDYIYDVFLFAREADPDTILYYNDYNMHNAGKATLVMNMVNDINARYAEEHPEANGRLLIEGIGMQEHQDLSTKVSDVEKSIQKFISTGARISITELDIGYGSKKKSDTLTKEEEITQALCYARMFQLFKKYSDNIERVSFWGVDDKSSWRNNLVCIFNGDFSAKEAFYAVLDPEAYLIEHDPNYVPEVIDTAEIGDVTNVDNAEQEQTEATTTLTTTDNLTDSTTNDITTKNDIVSASTSTGVEDGFNPIIIVIIIIVIILIGTVIFVMKHGKKE